MADPILVASSDHTCSITLNRPDKRNALSIELVQALLEALATAEGDPAQRVVILAGAGPVFCAGLDLVEAADPAKAHRSAELIGQALRRLSESRLVTIAVVHGSQRLTYTLDTLFGYQTNVPDTGTATWFGVINYLTYQATPQLSGTTRLEFFDDIDGNRTGFKGLYTALTAGLNFQPRKDIILRPEIRYDNNSKSRPFEGKRGLFTATFDVVLRW